MTFQVRHPVVENQFCSFNLTSTAADAAALHRRPGRRGETVDGRANVDLITSASADTPIGFLMQKIKKESTDFPPGFRFRSDMGSSDAYLGDPVGVAAGRGAVYETDQYNDVGADGITAGTKLYCDNSGKLADTNVNSAADYSAIAMNTLTATQVTAGVMLRITSRI